MSHSITVTLLAAFSSVGALSTPAAEKPAARPETKSTETLWPFARAAASAGGVPSARKLFGVYDETTPTEAPSATPTGAPTIIPPCDGTFVDFEGVDPIILEILDAREISDGSGLEVAFIANPNNTASFVSDVSEAGNISLAATTYTSGGVFATRGGEFDFGPFEDAVIAAIIFPEEICEVSFGFAIDSSEPVDAAIEIIAESPTFNVSAAPGEFDRASGFVQFSRAEGFSSVTMNPLVPAGDIRTIIIDNVCFVPCP